VITRAIRQQLAALRHDSKLRRDPSARGFESSAAATALAASAVLRSRRSRSTSWSIMVIPDF
jgi:hypothetical protein